MAGAPVWKVIDQNKTYQASCKSVLAALTLLNSMYPGGVIRWGATSGPIAYRWTREIENLEDAAREARDEIARYQEQQWRMANPHADPNE